MSIDLYYTPGSPPCRLVLLVATALDIHFNLKLIDLGAREQLKPDFLKLNPQHTLPTIVDDGFILWESRAISRYLFNKYGGDNELYPKDPQARALIDQRLDFDLGTLYSRFTQYAYPQIFGGQQANEADGKKFYEGLAFFETYLSNENKYAAGDKLTLADLALVVTVSTIDAAGISLASFPNVERWFALVKSTAPGYEEFNQRGVEVFKSLIIDVNPKRKL